MVNFKEVKKGYDKEQVDTYIKTIDDEYQKVLAEYQVLEDKIEELRKDTPQKEAIAAALINAEISGKQVVANAYLEAQRIIVESERELGQIIEAKKSVLEEIDKLFNGLGDVLNVYSGKEQVVEDKEVEGKKGESNAEES